MKNRLILVVRAFNDLDCRLPILYHYSKLYPKNSEIFVVPIPTNTGFGNFVTEEIKNELNLIGAKIKPIYSFSSKSFLIKQILRLYHVIPNKMRNTTIRRFFASLKRKIFKIIHFITIRDKEIINGFLHLCRESIILIDEIIYMPGRSFFVDIMIQNAEDIKILSFHTGQDPYINLWIDKKDDEAKFKLDTVKNIPLLVPGNNDKNIYRKKLKKKNIEVIGNTRFDRIWVNKQSQISKAKIKKNVVLREKHKNKIVFMLSKIEYGVDRKNIVNIINECAKIKDSKVLVKPHTRGMSLNSLNFKFNKNIIDGARYDSSLLIEWSDTILFTGSSIIFQAMMLHKKIIYLKYCQKYQTLFDEFNSICIAKNQNDALNYIKNYTHTEKDAINLTSQVNEHAQNKIKDGKVCSELIKNYL